MSATNGGGHGAGRHHGPSGPGRHASWKAAKPVRQRRQRRRRFDGRANGQGPGGRVITTAGSARKTGTLPETRGRSGDQLSIRHDVDAAVREFAPQGVNVWWETLREPNSTHDRPAGRAGRMILMAGREARPVFPVGPFYVKECSLFGFVMFNATPEEQQRGGRRHQRLARSPASSSRTSIATLPFAGGGRSPSAAGREHDSQGRHAGRQNRAQAVVDHAHSILLLRLRQTIRSRRFVHRPKVRRGLRRRNSGARTASRGAGSSCPRGTPTRPSGRRLGRQAGRAGRAAGGTSGLASPAVAVPAGIPVAAPVSPNRNRGPGIATRRSAGRDLRCPLRRAGAKSAGIAVAIWADEDPPAAATQSAAPVRGTPISKPGVPVGRPATPAAIPCWPPRLP